ncbi:DNA-binding protein [Brevundimonas phage vB_BpoS-Kikimora]|uniref:Cell division transcriptional repressor protein n=2 Tax=Kikimoravirus TaxID=3425051 RepID=A0A9E7STD7_9CAUD|nr:DNA-binding protein [Brevundimonas phage vB_BpoS-Kikimora]UTC28237.1 cell division transcriptional repressor protein [Brevundimonas phage vB_BpoS-Gurke]
MTTEPIEKPKRGKKPDSHAMKPIDFLISNRIERRRTSVGMSQTTLARKIGLTPQQIKKYEAGVNRVSAGTLFFIGQALGVSPNHFYQGGDEVSPNVATLTAEDAASIQEGESVMRLYLKLSDRDRSTILALTQSLSQGSK